MRQPLGFRGRDDAYGGPLVVLVDAHSANSAEVLAAGLQATDRARVVGSRMAGAVLPLGQVPLLTGGMLRLPRAEFWPRVAHGSKGSAS